MRLSRPLAAAWPHSPPLLAENRISRCFFGPIKRPPFNRDELLDDIDYYPDAYLDRLAQEGINGLWLTVVFSEICSTSFFPENPDAERRRQKLCRSVEKCRRYGIRLWVFAIEPRAWNRNLPRPELIPDGPPAYDLSHTFCPNSPASEKYLYESTNSLFSRVPHLGGLLLISVGERPTSCLSCRNMAPESGEPPACQKTCGLGAADILAKVLNPMRRGIRDANPEAELISWFYLPQPEQPHPWIYELPEKLGQDIIISSNFESGCTKQQLGKFRVGGDYWLSCAGPSERYGRFAALAKGRCGLAAKIQVGCSHEVATIPFVPAPGLLYRKYREMKHLGVQHVMQCWYFGNYPGIMNRAAGRLAYEDFADGERGFLTRLACAEWGNHAEDMVAVWEKLADAYRDYPLDFEFQYYGPMHDGTTWPLHLQAVRQQLPRSWKPEKFAAGDAVGEFLNSFTLDEVMILARRIAEKWHEGFLALSSFINEFATDQARLRDASLIEALDCHFQAGADILEFYFLRNRMLKTNDSTCLDRLEELVRQEMTVSERLAVLCTEDPRLGYHSEAEVYKYFPEKLRWRTRTLQSVLRNDFPFCRQALAAGKKLRDILIPDDHLTSGQFYASESFRWQAERCGEFLKITLDIAALPPLGLDTLVIFAGDLLAEMHPWAIALSLTESPVITDSRGEIARGKITRQGDRFLAEILLPLAVFPEPGACRLGFQRQRNDAGGHDTWENFPAGTYDNDIRLHYGAYSPDRMITLYF